MRRNRSSSYGNRQGKERGRGAIVYVSLALAGGLALVLALAGNAGATSTYLSQFNQRYGTSGSRLDTCQLCHHSASGGDQLNPYGLDFTAHSHDFASIESLDSDGDTYSNVDEIHALTFPGDSSDYPGAPKPTPTPAAWPASQIPGAQDLLKQGTSGLPVLGGTFGGQEGGVVPAPFAQDAGKFVEAASHGTTESCTKPGCHPDKVGKPHYFNVAPAGDADCWVCHTKHIVCTVCHRVGAGESVGHVAGERVQSFTGLNIYPETNQADALVAHEAPEANYAVRHGGLIARDMPADFSSVSGDAMDVGQGRQPRHTEATEQDVDDTTHDSRFYERLGENPTAE